MRRPTIAVMLLLAVGLFTTAEAKEEARSLSLEQAIDVALENNRYRPISRLGVEIAEAQYSQVMSSYWPQIAVRSAFARLDEDPTTIFPEETDTYTITDFLPQPIEATVTVPEKHIKLLDKTHFVTTGTLVLPIYTGGQRRGMRQQARAGVRAAKQVVRRTDLQVTYDVRRMYYGALLARELVQLGEDTVARLEVTLELTENLYKRGSGKVKKTDYLKHKVMVESIRSIVSTLRSNKQLAEAALVNTMGLDWDTDITVVEPEIPFVPFEGDLKRLVGSSYRFSPDWARLEAGLDAAEGQVKEAKSGYWPKLAFQGQVQVLANSYDAGIVGPSERKSWRIGVGMELPLFNGFLTKQKVREARARLERLRQQKTLLHDGLALQVKHLFLGVSRAQEQQESAGEALKAASDNRRLNVRAYQDDLVELQDVVESQLMESFVKARYLKVLYDHVEAKAHLEFVIGREIDRLVTGG
ncbi:MAG: TolC family protein [Candidatus Latescibacteria bacterium]|jgi:outer membrane protein TolC|nr:TolC family protein [Candidatus Latescibacterota bacterium]